MTPLGLIVRLFACVGLMAATWNPSGYSYAHWLGGDAPLALQALATAALLSLHIVFGRIAWLSMRAAGTALVVATLGAGLLALAEAGAIDLGRGVTAGYAVVAVAGLTIAIGVGWSAVKRRVTGQSNYLNQPP